MTESKPTDTPGSGSPERQQWRDDALIEPFLAFAPRLVELAECLRLIPDERARAALARAQANRPTSWEPLPSFERLMGLPRPGKQDVSPDRPVF